MLHLNYQIHKILNSKYRVFINLFFILLIYSFIYGDKLIYCMNENTTASDIPVRAEEKETQSHQVQALMREVRSYAGSQIYLLEHIVDTEKTVDFMLEKYQEQQQANKALLNSLGQEEVLHEKIRSQAKTIGRLGNRIGELKPLAQETEYYRELYTEQCRLNGKLGHTIGELRQEISATTVENEALYDTNSRLTDQLKVERNRVDNLRRALALKKELLKNIK